jgi:hypothetical protein
MTCAVPILFNSIPIDPKSGWQSIVECRLFYWRWFPGLRCRCWDRGLQGSAQTSVWSQCRSGESLKFLVLYSRRRIWIPLCYADYPDRGSSWSSSVSQHKYQANITIRSQSLPSKTLIYYSLMSLHFFRSQWPRGLRQCPAWQRWASTCGRALLPHADKHMFVYVLELCKSEAKRFKAWTVFASSNTGIVGSNSTQGMDVCVSFFLCLCCV